MLTFLDDRIDCVHINKKSHMTTTTSSTVETQDVTLKVEYNASLMTTPQLTHQIIRRSVHIGGQDVGF